MTRSSAWLACLVVACSLPAGAQRSGGQLPPLKRALLPTQASPACASIATVAAAPADSQRLRARDLAERGQQAAVLGDNATALVQLRNAAALDPTNPDLAYQLGRVYQNADSAQAAVTMYCRFLALAPTTGDAADAQARIAALATPTTDPMTDRANVALQRGLSAYDRGAMSDAEANFSAALAAQPAWADAYFDRALARVARGDRAGAASDFESYLRGKPEATDRVVATAELEQLRRPSLSTTNALGLGLLIPGGGQFYTHRPGWGLVSLAAAVSAIGYAAESRAISTTEQQTAKDPFGNPYTFNVTVQETTHPHVVPGVAIAGGIAILAAFEAAAYVRRTNEAPRRVSVVLLPTAGGVSASVVLR